MSGDDDFMGNLLKQAQAMQEQMLAAQANAAAQTVEGQAGGGRVKITATGGMEFTAVRIDPSGVLYVLTDGPEGSLYRLNRGKGEEDKEKTHL